MKKNFYCHSCQHQFSTEAVKQERQDPILGPVWNWVADCPQCGQIIKEFKQALSTDDGNRETQTSTPTCATGACPFAN